MATINYPAWATTRADKWLYCRRLSKKLRSLHNVMGTWYRDGISQATYDQLPNKVRSRYSYSVGVNLTAAQWDEFVGIWEGYSRAMWEKLNVVREDAENSTSIVKDVDIDRDIS